MSESLWDDEGIQRKHRALIVTSNILYGDTFQVILQFTYNLCV